MKKFLAILSAAAVFCGAVCGCANRDTTSSSVEWDSELLYLKAAKVTMSDSFSEIRSLSTGSGGNVLIFGKLTTGGWCGYVTNSRFSDYTEFSFTPQEGETVMSASMLSYEKKGVLTVLDGKTLIYIYDKENKYEKTIDCGEVLDEDEIYARIYGYGDDGFIVNVGNERVIAIDHDGRYRGDIRSGGMNVSGVHKNKDNIVNIMLTDVKNMYIDEINASELETVRKHSYTMPLSVYAIGAGAGEYGCVSVADGAIYGISDTEAVKLSDFIDMEFNDYEIREIAMVSEKEFVIVTGDGTNDTMYLLSERDISDIKSKETIIMASFSQSGSGDYADEVKAFNAASEDYRIEYRNYFSRDRYEQMYDDLRLDMISGNAPDIIPLNGNLPVDTFNTDIFCDLYEFIDKEPDLSREDFLPNIRKGLERDGRMVMFTPTFGFNTVTAKAGYTGVRENWSVDDMIAAYKATPEGMSFFADEDISARSGFFETVAKQWFFVDYDKAECHFDSPEFIKLLNFFNDNDIGLTFEEYTSQTGNIAFESRNTDIFTGKRFVEFTSSFGNFEQLFWEVRGSYEDQCIFTGYPYDGNESGSGIELATCYGIMANSSHKEGAWSFLRTLLSDDFYSIPSNYSEFPVLEKLFDERAQQSVTGFIKYNWNDKISNEMEKKEWSCEIRDNTNGDIIAEFDVEPFTQEECDHYKDLIKNAEPVRWDSTIRSIIWEETLDFFNEERTAEDCAAMIQSRVSLYLSEKYK